MTIKPESSRFSFAQAIAVCLTIGLGLMAYYVLFIVFDTHLSGDQSWYLYASKSVLSGTKLYGPQLTETNPPLIIWLMLLPVYVANLFHVHSSLALKLSMLLVIVGVAWWNRNILRRVAPVSEGNLITRLIIASTVIELVVRPEQFAQREQLIVVLLLPYILSAVTPKRGSVGKVEAIALGVAAGVGICLKPFQLGDILLVELFVAASTRSLRRLLGFEFISFALTGLLYVLLIARITPLYLKETIPLLSNTYWAFGRFTASQMLFEHGRYATVSLILMSVIWSQIRKRLSWPMIAGGLLAASWGGLIAYTAQHAAFVYQKYPELDFLMMAAVWIVFDVALTTRKSRWADISLSALQVTSALVFAVILIGLTTRILAKHQPDRSTLFGELATYPANTKIYVFSATMPEMPLVLERDLTWSSRYAHLWMLPAIVQNESATSTHNPRYKSIDPAKLASLASLQRQTLSEDLAFWKPTYILVRECQIVPSCSEFNRPFDMLGWFMQSAQFRQEWAHYAIDHTIAEYSVFRRTTP